MWLGRICICMSNTIETFLHFLGAKMDLLNRITSEMQHTCSKVDQILRCGSKMSSNHSNKSTSISSVTHCNLDWLPEIFGDQDDAWIEILLAITDLYVLSKTWYVSPEKILLTLLFLSLLLLMSPQNCLDQCTFCNHCWKEIRMEVLWLKVVKHRKCLRERYPLPSRPNKGANYGCWKQHKFISD